MDANIIVVLPIEEPRWLANWEPERLLIVALDAPEVAKGAATVQEGDELVCFGC
jgi:hypothetical protein